MSDFLKQSDVTPQMKEEIMEVLPAAATSTKVFAKTFMPEVFYAEFEPRIHDPLFAAIDDPDLQKVAVQSVRGLGKTSIVAKAWAARLILFRLARYIVYITSTEALAVQKTENLKRELIRNPRIRAIFGDIRVSDSERDNPEFEDVDEDFTKTAWVANGQTAVFPRGGLQPVRGILFDSFRPDVIIIDDLEDRLKAKSEIYREERWDWLWGDVSEAVDQWGRDYKIAYTDTVKHQDSCLVRLEEAVDWETVKLPICDAEFRTLAPGLMPQEKLDAKLEAHRVSGTMDVFYREFMCQPMSAETQVFKKEHFRYYHETDTEFVARKSALDNVVIIDPAKTPNPKSADSAIVGVGFDFQRDSVYVRDIIAGKYTPDEVWKHAFDMAKRLNAHVIGVETTGLGKFATWGVENEMRLRGQYYEIVELKAVRGQMEKGKIERIRLLIPHYRLGRIFHNPNCCERLEKQLMSFPNARLWDIMDALGYVVQILAEGERFFAGNIDEEDDSVRAALELAELNTTMPKEKPIETGTWFDGPVMNQLEPLPL